LARDRGNRWLTSVKIVRRAAQQCLQFLPTADILNNGRISQVSVSLPVYPIFWVWHERQAIIVYGSGWEVSVVIVAVHSDRDAQLPDVAQTCYPLRLRPRLA
jgi:hypothetical protein